MAFRYFWSFFLSGSLLVPRSVTLCQCLVTMGLLHQCPLNFVLSMNFLLGLLWRAMRLMRVDGVSNGFDAYVVTMFHFPSGWVLRWIVYLVSSSCTDDDDWQSLCRFIWLWNIAEELRYFNTCFVCRLDVY